MPDLQEISGGCHCGNITYVFCSPTPKLELPIRSCSCSFCSKHGACYTSDPKGSLRVRVRHEKQIQHYRFGTGQAAVFLCSHCGVYPFIIGDIGGNRYAAINANSIDGLLIDRSVLPPALSLEQQSAAERVARWQRFWIPQVSIEYLNQAVTAAILS